ncbi:MAG: type I secretion system permease/ATPase, partial [Alphaproteobacteria bacterium]|nr:type I secretion system permease/ATPase [Alphaproteobacteria bacterium]
MSSLDAERSVDQMRAALGRCVGGILFASLVGFFINLLHLAVPLYMMQVYDRVLNSRSHDTLLMLTVLVLGAILFMTTLDFIRSRVFIITAERLVHRLQGATFRAAVADSLRNQSPNATQATRDLQELRQFITTGPVALPMDALFSPLLLGVLFLLHPVYGIIAVAGLAAMLVLSLLMELVARRPSGQANDAALRAHQDVNAAIRHAEAIEGLGMITAVQRRWQRSQRRALDLVGGGNSAARAISAVSRGFRVALQVAVLAAGAELAIDTLASAGSITAATILMGRFLAPFDQLLDGWRQWTNAGSALGRLRRLLAQHRETRSATPVEAASGRLVAERVTFV